jgi:hypothetical protein
MGWGRKEKKQSKPIYCKLFTGWGTEFEFQELNSLGQLKRTRQLISVCFQTLHKLHCVDMKIGYSDDILFPGQVFVIRNTHSLSMKWELRTPMSSLAFSKIRYYQYQKYVVTYTPGGRIQTPSNSSPWIRVHWHDRCFLFGPPRSYVGSSRTAPYPVELRPKKDCADDAQQQLKTTDRPLVK